MLAIDHGVVRTELAEAGCTEPLAAIMPRLRAGGVRPISSNGVLGDPDGASAAEGHRFLEAMTTELAAAVASRWPRSGPGT
jgi:creatinine amidohydrolase